MSAHVESLFPTSSGQRTIAIVTDGQDRMTFTLPAQADEQDAISRFEAAQLANHQSPLMQLLPLMRAYNSRPAPETLEEVFGSLLGETQPAEPLTRAVLVNALHTELVVLALRLRMVIEADPVAFRILNSATGGK